MTNRFKWRLSQKFKWIKWLCLANKSRTLAHSGAFCLFVCVRLFGKSNSNYTVPYDKFLAQESEREREREGRKKNDRQNKCLIEHIIADKQNARHRAFKVQSEFNHMQFVYGKKNIYIFISYENRMYVWSLFFYSFSVGLKPDYRRWSTLARSDRSTNIMSINEVCTWRESEREWMCKNETERHDFMCK